MQDVGSKEDTELCPEDLTLSLAGVVCRIAWTLSVYWKIGASRVRPIAS
jgi:hypothetical protein